MLPDILAASVQSIMGATHCPGPEASLQTAVSPVGRAGFSHADSPAYRATVEWPHGGMRWSRHTRNWSLITLVTLNPERDEVVKADENQLNNIGSLA